MASDPVSEHASELLGNDTSATPTLTRLRDRIERGSRAASGLVTTSGHESGVRKFAPLFVDLTMLLLAIGATKVVSSMVANPSASIYWDTAFVTLVLCVLAARGAYSPKLRPHLLDDVRMIVSATAVTTMALISFRVVVADDPYTSSQTALTWLMAAVFLSGGRTALWASRARAISRGEGRPTLIVGAGRIGNLVARRLMQRPEFGLTPVGFLDNDPLELNGQRAPLPVLGASWDLEEVVRDHGVEHVIFTFSTAPHNVLLGMVRRCQAVGVSTSLVPRLFEVAVERVSVEHIGGLPLFNMRPADPKGWQFEVKYIIDRVVAGLLILLASPLLAGLALATRISVGSPIFFRQRRIGLDGNAFDMLKFRTMKHPTEAGESKDDVVLPSDTAPGGVEGEDRRTRVGKLLRATSLDELPQLFNVLMGRMSIVGPRPERPEFVELFREDIHRYSDRHRVKSGITGWAQIHGLRGQTSISDRAEWDNYYIENWSLWLDFKIAIMTIPAVLMRHGE